MNNAPAFTFAQLLGRAPKAAPTTPEATSAKATPATAVTADSRLPPVGAGNKFAYLLRRPTKAVKNALQKPRTQPSNSAPMTPAKTPVSQFAHLAPDRITAYGQDAAEAPAAASAPVTAAAVLAAAAKAKTPTGTNLPPPTGMAAKVLAAAEKSRTPTSAPPPTDPLAAAVIAAGKKRRGEA